MEPEEEDETTPDLASAPQALPLLADDLYLKMQAVNLAAVDTLLEGMETQLLHEYIELDRTPIPTFTMVSALSQLWLFGVYELLRTWRQRARHVLRFADDVRSLATDKRAARIAPGRSGSGRSLASFRHTDATSRRVKVSTSMPLRGTCHQMLPVVESIRPYPGAIPNDPSVLGISCFAK